jgi:hypothetical protein
MHIGDAVEAPLNKLFLGGNRHRFVAYDGFAMGNYRVPGMGLFKGRNSLVGNAASHGGRHCERHQRFTNRCY